MDVPTVAGAVSAALFASSSVPMIWRAAATRDMSSYSRPHLVITNLGNAVHTCYLLALPWGPIHALHLMHVAVAAFMLLWHVRHASGAGAERTSARGAGPPRPKWN